MPARKYHCDHVAATLVPRSLTASPIVLGIIFPKKCYYVFKKLDFNIFLINRSFIRPPSLEPRRKMTANGLSSYQLFIKNLTFVPQKLKFPAVFDIFCKGSDIIYDFFCVCFTPRYSIGYSMGYSIRYSIGCSIRYSIGHSIGYSMGIP